MADRRKIYIKTQKQLRGFRQGLNYSYIDGRPVRTKKGYRVNVVKR